MLSDGFVEDSLSVSEVSSAVVDERYGFTLKCYVVAVVVGSKKWPCRLWERRRSEEDPCRLFVMIIGCSSAW